MYVPNYTITSKILSNINDIECLYGRLEGMKIPQSLFVNLQRDNLIESSYASNSIEGNPLSQAAVTNLLLNERVPVNRDEKEVVNYFNILKNLEKRVQEPLDVQQILGIHKELLNGVDEVIKGQVRNKEIIVGNRAANGEIFTLHYCLPWLGKHS